MPYAAVRHGWWGDGRRSYTRFARWAWGDSRMPSMHPAWRYYCLPNLSETMLAEGAAAAAHAAGLLDPWPAAAWLWRRAERTAIGRFRAPREPPHDRPRRLRPKAGGPCGPGRP